MRWLWVFGDQERNSILNLKYAPQAHVSIACSLLGYSILGMYVEPLEDRRN